MLMSLCAETYWMNRKSPVRHLLLVITFLIGNPGLLVPAAEPTLVQSAGHNNGDLDRPYCTASFPSNNAAGNLIVVAVEIGATAADHPFISVHDTQGNTYHPATTQPTWRTNGGGSSAQIFYAPNIRPGPNTVTMSEPNAGGGSGAGNAFNQIAIHEYAGVCSASPLDVTAAATGVTTNSPFTVTSGSATTSVNGELVFGYGNTLSAFLAAGAGFTARQTNAGTSEDMVQALAGPVEATEINSANNTPYVMLMATFKPSPELTDGPVLPPQGNRTIPALTTVIVTNSAAEVITNPVTTSTILFNYTNRTALLADGWSFIATNNGMARDTEITNSADGGLVSYDQTLHPGAVRIPCDIGILLGLANNSRNTLFRNLSSNWVSLRLTLSFAPLTNYHQAYLVLYQDDANYVELGFGHNMDLSTGQMVRILREANGHLNYIFTDTIWYNSGPGSPPVTNITLRLDRSLNTGVINAFSSLDGTNWPFVGSFGQSFVHPRLAIWTGGSQIPYTNHLIACDFQQLDILMADPPPGFTYQLVDPPAGAAINTNGVITWTPTWAQRSTTNTIRTVVTDNREPPLSATNSFTVLVETNPPTVKIRSINVTNGIAIATWDSMANQTYRLQYQDTLCETNWQDVTPDAIATGLTTNGTNFVGDTVQRFYRVMWVP
jgi:hypothetical protein